MYVCERVEAWFRGTVVQDFVTERWVTLTTSSQVLYDLRNMVSLPRGASLRWDCYAEWVIYARRPIRRRR